ncbi:hypothetical protein NECAME_02489, partial [Necator americanus]
TPTSSSHSLSPTTSTSSEDTDRSLFAGKQSRAVTTNRNAAMLEPRGAGNDKKEAALRRIIEEANELKRKEQELRGVSGYTVAKSSRTSATSSRSKDDHKTATVSSAISMYSHTRKTSDGNNNSISNALRAANENNPSPKRTRPTFAKVGTLQPSDSSNSWSSKQIHSKDYVRGTWTATQAMHSSPQIERSKGVQERKSPSPSNATYKSYMVLENKKDCFQSRLRPSAFLTEDRTPAKLPHLKEGKQYSPSQEKKEETPTINPPQAPDSGSNIRKVKEAVRQQTLGHKSANNLLQEKRSNLKKFDGNLDEKKETDFQGADVTVVCNEIPRVILKNRNDATVNDGVTNNISKMIKEGLPSLKKIGTPIEKNGIVLGKVVDDPTLVNSMVRHSTDFG